MESARSMVELGAEWSSFNGGSINDEAEFIAQLFPNSSLTNELESSSSLQALSSSSCWTSHDTNINIAGYYDDTNTSFYSSDNTNNSSFYSNFSQGSCNSYENYYLRDPHQFLEPQTGSLPFDFILSGANSTFSEVPDTNLQLKRDCEMSEIEPVAEEKSSDINIDENLRKRYRVSDNKGKRMAGPKKSQKIGCSDEENDDPTPNRQNSSSCSSQDDCNGSQEQNQLNGKTRANRGSATDPQSIYARKRRERINERLRILQSLVPNGTKVDISTMLEEAVRYVKFLQLQIKLLSSDELWMYAPLAYNGMDMGLDTLSLMINKTKTS